MRVIIVGNGLAGTIVAKTIREQDRKVIIDIFAEERFPYYPRPNLIGFLEGRIEFEKMFAFPEEWYSEQNINVHLAEPVTRIIPGLRQVETEGGNNIKYDFLILACGSQPFVPAINGSDKLGVFTLRTLDDAFELMAYIGDDRRVTVLGGGLLGLETARALKWRGVNVEVVEFFSHLLPRQLDRQGAALLKSQIEKMGIKVSLGLACEE
jgi:nitrite reductase (NADH) large subunit